jgi:hypothetical protein
MIFVSGISLSNNKCAPGGAFLGASITNNNCGCGDITNNNNGFGSCGCNGADIVNYNCGGTINNSGGIKSNCGCLPIANCCVAPAIDNNANNNANTDNTNNASADNSNNNQAPAEEIPADNSNAQAPTADAPIENTNENIADTSAEAAQEATAEQIEDKNLNTGDQICTCTNTKNLQSGRKVTKTVILKQSPKKLQSSNCAKPKLQAPICQKPKLQAVQCEKPKLQAPAPICENKRTNLQLKQSRAKVLKTIKKLQCEKPVQLQATRTWVNKKQFTASNCAPPKLQAKKLKAAICNAPILQAPRPKRVLKAAAPCKKILQANNNACGCDAPMIVNNNGFGAGNNNCFNPYDQYCGAPQYGMFNNGCGNCGSFNNCGC